jgi:hypothetical protein
LSEHEVETITINTSVSAPWDEAPFVNAVKVNIDYPSANEKHSALFQKDTPKNVWHFRRPKKDDGIVKYSSEVFFKGISEPVVLKEESTNSDININIGKIGLMDITFMPHPIISSLTGDNEIKIVQVDISYKEENHADHFVETVVLKTDKPEGERLTRILGKIIDAPLQYKATYFPKNNSPITGPEKKYYLTENNNVKLFIPSPYENTLDLPVELSQVPDASVKKIIVEFKYSDEANNFSSFDKIEMSAEEDWEPGIAKLVIMDKRNAKFQYRYRIICNDAMSKSAWMHGEGEETIILPIFKVNINASQLKLGQEFSNALLTLNYDNETKDTREIFLDQSTAAQVLSWYIPRTDNSQSTYSYLLKLMEQDGTSIETSGVNQGSVLILQAPEH